MNIKIGDRTKIHKTALIGIQPHALMKDENGDYIHKKAEQGVEIGDDCTIGPYTVIKSGMKRPTKIEDHVHICEFVNIGHDCRIGRNTRIMPMVLLNGWVEVGERVAICGGTSIRNRVKIGKNSFIGMDSTVTKDIPPGSFGYGSPFKVTERGWTWSRTKTKLRMMGIPI